MRTALPAILLVAVLSSPMFAQAAVNSIDVPPLIPIQDYFDLCVTAPGNSMAVLMISDAVGSTPTKYGTLGLQFPFLVILPLTVPPAGTLCVRTIAHCDRVVPGFTLHMQFISLGPAPGQHGLSNAATITFVDSGNCVPGQHVTFTESDYDAACPGSIAACLLQSQFGTVFPQGLILGDPDGIDGDAQYAEVFTSAAALQAFHPSALSQHPFSHDALDPTDSEAGDLAGQLAAARLNVDLDDAGAFQPFKNMPNGVLLGDMIFVQYVHPLLYGKSVRDVIALADGALSQAIAMPMDINADGMPDISFDNLADALSRFNANYEGVSNNEVLANPWGP